MKTVYFVRHGQSVANLNKVYGGQKQFDLTEKGIQQAKNTTKLFKDKVFTKIISSDLIRAKDTAQIIKKESNLDFDIEIWTELNEVNAGEYEGFPVGEKFSSILEAAIKSENGESEKEILERAQLFIDKLKKLKEEKILVVGHNSFTSVIFYLLDKVKDKSLIDYRKEWEMNNAEIRTKII